MALVARRAQSTVWLEAASIREEDRTVCLRFCCQHSPLGVDVFVDAGTQVVFADGNNGEVRVSLRGTDDAE
jgi:hypothetical protein